MKIFLIALFGIITTFFGLVPQAMAAEGDLVWQDDYPEIGGFGTDGFPFDDTNHDAVYTAIWEDYVTGKVKVSKRVHGDPGAKWDTSINIVPPQGNTIYPWSLAVTGDSTGVYVAAPTQIANNLSNGRLALAKLTPQGAFVGNINQVSNGYVTLRNITVDASGVYVIGGGDSVVIEKWSKDLSVSLWKKTSRLSGGDWCDFRATASVAQDDDYLYLGGCVSVGNNGATASRVEKIDKISGDPEWRRIDGSAPSIAVIAVDGTNLYIGASSGYGGFNYFKDFSSVLQKRTLDNDVVWTKNFNGELITALAIDGGGIYRGFIDSDGVSRMMKVDKRRLSDGNQVGTKTITSGVTAYHMGTFVLSNAIYYSRDSMSIDSTGIYLAGALGTQCGGLFGACTRTGGRVEKYGHLGTPGCGTVTDADGNTYDTVVIGTQCWMKENMRVGMMINASTPQTNNGVIEKYCYNNQASNCTTNHPNYPDGGIYTWNEAMQYSTAEGAQGICPAGWHIPTGAEWHALENYLKDGGQACDENRGYNIDWIWGGDWSCDRAGMRLKTGGGSGFEANLTGMASWIGVGGPYDFGMRDQQTYFWTSHRSNQPPEFLDSPALWYGLFSVHSQVYRGLFDDSAAYSVRCVQGLGAVPPPPSTAKICLNSCTSSFRYDTVVLPGGFSMTVGDPARSLHACVGTGNCTAGDSPVSGTWSEGTPSGGSVSIAPTGSSPSTAVSAIAGGTELVHVDIPGYPQVSAEVNVIACIETVDCDDEKQSVCTGSTVPSGTVKVGTCGTVDCSGQAGTRYCDMNWKEVAPGQ